jgi:hypothetical protein
MFSDTPGLPSVLARGALLCALTVSGAGCASSTPPIDPAGDGRFVAAPTGNDRTQEGIAR